MEADHDYPLQGDLPRPTNITGADLTTPLRTLLVVVLAIGAVTLTTGGCGTMAGDCSGGTADGAGGCIPDDHGPTAAQQAAFKHFDVDDAACFDKGPFRYQGHRYHQYACKAIRGHHLQNDETYCVMLNRGLAIPDSQTAVILAARPTQRARCPG